MMVMIPWRKALAALVLAALVPGTWMLHLRAELVSHWPLDGDLTDAGPAGNDGVFTEGRAPQFGPGFDGAAGGSLSLDGEEESVDIEAPSGLPIAAGRAYSVAFWLRGGPQPGGVVYAESMASGGARFTLGADASGASGKLEVTVAGAAGVPLLDGRLSSAAVLDGAWHHVAWVDNGGRALLYVDGRRDATDFTYARPALPLEATSIGAVSGGVACCYFQGSIDDVRVFDHPLSEFEVGTLLPLLPGCPAGGDTHCGGLAVEALPPGGAGNVRARALAARDDSGDAVRYYFAAVGDDGAVVDAGPQSQSTADLDLPPGTWTVSVTVDDDPACNDLAPDAACFAAPVTVLCPSAGDTHCPGLVVTGPPDGGPGTYTVSAAGSTDESGDPILYTLAAESDEGRRIALGPQAASSFTLQLGDGRWTIEVTVDDDPACSDRAGDATCTARIAVGCPPAGDTHCDAFQVTSHQGLEPGIFEAEVLGARDDSGDPVLYAFAAGGPAGTVELGPQLQNRGAFVLTEGAWTITATVDDDLLCGDRAADAVCTEMLTVKRAAPGLVSRWSFDGSTADAGPGGNHGAFAGKGVESYGDGFDGTPGGALLLDGGDDCIEVQTNAGLPLAAHAASTVALWVRGPPQLGGRVWAEGAGTSGNSLFAIGADPGGETGRVAVFLRSAGGQVILADRLSARAAFDGGWHHLAWVDDRGRAVLYIDGIRDPADFSHRRPFLQAARSTIGCVAPDSIAQAFAGAIDEVRAYKHALSEAEVQALVPEPPGCPKAGDTHCGGISVFPPPGGGEGTYIATADATVDDSGEPLIFTFSAASAAGDYLQAGPQAEVDAEFELTPGVWTVAVTVDDDLACRDRAADARCAVEVTVAGPPALLLSRWEMNGDTFDAEPAMNDGIFVGGPGPEFEADREGLAASALRLDGVDDAVLVRPSNGLPLHAHAAYSVAMWVRGGGAQVERSVWAESSGAALEGALFAIGPDFRGGTGRADVFIRDATGAPILNHVRSQGTAFDGAWHHLAWVDAGGEALLYIDGHPDATSFRYEKTALALDATAIGGAVLGGAACCSFEGLLDDVRAYTYALSRAEVEALAGVSGIPFHRGDANDDGGVNLTDPIYVLNFLFLGGPRPACAETADANDDGIVNLTDPVVLLNFLFLGGSPPADPGVPGEGGGPCGLDPPGSTDLGCGSYSGC